MNIPEKTIERLSEYRRTLLSCHEQGITHIFSHVLAGIHGITAVQVRRDLMLIGFSSDTKKGYDVEVLIDFISGILDNRSVVNRNCGLSRHSTSTRRKRGTKSTTSPAIRWSVSKRRSSSSTSKS